MDMEKEGSPIGDKEACCSNKGCMCVAPGGGKRGGCGCGAKMLMVVLLFLVGGIIGYLMGSHCGGGYHHMEMCPYSMPAPAPMK